MQLGFFCIRFQGTSDHRLPILYLDIVRDICARISAFAVPPSGPGELTVSETAIILRLPTPRYLILQVLNAISILSELFDGLVHDFEAQETLIVLLDLQIAILIAHVKAVFTVLDEDSQLVLRYLQEEEKCFKLSRFCLG